MRSREKFISIVVPFFNEENNVKKIFDEITEAVKANNLNAEIIFVNDGSGDNTLAEMQNLKPLKIISLLKNFGQTSALDAGISEAKGEIIITLDGDLQNDPADFPRLLDKMDEGYDVVSGWRKNRKDPFSKKFISRGADFLRKFLVDDKIHDSGCTLKAYKKECFDGVELYGEMHRFIPAVIRIQGYKIGEVEVNHRPRLSGVTKYNYKRMIKGFLDMASVWFWRKYSSRPLHLFGGMGLLLTFAGTLIILWMAVERMVLGTPLGSRVWPMIGVFMILAGLQFFISGLLADISIKSYHQIKQEKPYKIKQIVENS